jgi:hypothetical protein
MFLIGPVHHPRPWTLSEFWIILLIAGSLVGFIALVFIRCRIRLK